VARKKRDLAEEPLRRPLAERAALALECRRDGCHVDSSGKEKGPLPGWGAGPLVDEPFAVTQSIIASAPMEAE
jgi:hypothetical protein